MLAPSAPLSCGRLLIPDELKRRRDTPADRKSRDSFYNADVIGMLLSMDEVRMNPDCSCDVDAVS